MPKKKGPYRPDIDSILAGLLAMAANKGAGWTRKGDKVSFERKAKAAAGRRRAALARRKAGLGAAVEREAARRRARDRRRRYGERIVDRMLVGMAPGGWYGRGDLIRFAGVGRYARGKVQQGLLARGLVRRQRNPAYGRQLDPWQIMAGQEQEPIWLYALTPLGELERAALMLMQ